MAVYNGEKYLKTQLESILSQTEPVDEIIIVDDGSSDNSVEILRKYSQKDTRFKIFQNRTNLGYKQNFRKAISLCHGDMIFLSDQDDCWFPEKVRTMKAVMENHPDIETFHLFFYFSFYFIQYD
ncbi:glycosyltransferase, partial [Faecalibaculum rodentium]|uniref:glycosyltransferase n=1 Tax=Faecalibaculum rodentium TaxID=1702221 RepID=UPI00248C96F7